MSAKCREVFEAIVGAVPDGTNPKDVTIALVLMVASFAATYAKDGHAEDFLKQFAKDAINLVAKINATGSDVPKTLN